MTDEDRLRLERRLALLRLENQSLRAHLAAENPGSRIAGLDDAVVPAAELETLQRARKDLRWLLKRLGRGPIGWIVRRREGFRRLEQDWGD